MRNVIVQSKCYYLGTPKAPDWAMGADAVIGRTASSMVQVSRLERCGWARLAGDAPFFNRAKKFAKTCDKTVILLDFPEKKMVGAVRFELTTF